jgi:hypothetical protein
MSARPESRTFCFSRIIALYRLDSVGVEEIFENPTDLDFANRLRRICDGHRCSLFSEHVVPRLDSPGDRRVVSKPLGDRLPALVGMLIPEGRIRLSKTHEYFRIVVCDSVDCGKVQITQRLGANDLCVQCLRLNERIHEVRMKVRG